MMHMETGGGPPSVSVVLPTYQRRELVQRAVASVLAQTQRDFELIVIDDGSTDGTDGALADLGDAIRYQWQPNSGVAAARNTGIRLARAPLVAFLDSDDRWLPDHLEVVTNVLRGHPEAVLVSTRDDYVMGGNEPADRAEVVDVLPQLMLAFRVGAPSCTAARRDALVAAGGFDERLWVAEDSELWVRLAMRGPFAHVRRRTVVRQATVGSLGQRGRRSGGCLDGWEIGWPRIISELERLERDDRATLIAQAEGHQHLIRAVQALGRRDEPRARLELDRACQRAPELSNRPFMVAHRLSQLPSSGRPSERLRLYRAAAELWPDPRAEAALYLRLRAASFAIRRGRVIAVARLMRGWPIRATPSFLASVLPGVMRILRRRLRDYRDRG